MKAMSWGQFITSKVEGHVLVVTIDKPPFNHVSVDLMSDLADCLDDELVPELVGGFRFLEDELDLAGVVAQVDEDETAVVAAGVDPAGDRQALPDVLGTQLAAPDVAPAHALSVATTSERPTVSSGVPARRIVASPARSTTSVAAPVRAPCVSWPFTDRPAKSRSAATPA